MVCLDRSVERGRKQRAALGRSQKAGAMTPEQSYGLFLLAVMRKALEELRAVDPASIPIPDDDDDDDLF